jgi:hypothetical protein
MRSGARGLIEGLVRLFDGYGDLQITDDGGGLRFRCTPAPGLRSFVTVERDPASLFSRTVSIEVSTLVGVADMEHPDVAHPDLVKFLDEANAAGLGGAWRFYGNGDVGVTGHMLVTGAGDRDLPGLVRQLLALQSLDASSVGRPHQAAPLEDLTTPTSVRPWVVPRRVLTLGALAERLWWRSGSHQANRWEQTATGSNFVDFGVPLLVGNPLRNPENEAQPLRTVTVALAEHPRRGPGVLVQATCVDELRQAVIDCRHIGVLTSSARWFGTGLGGLRLADGSSGEADVLYRAFLPLDLLGMVDVDAAVDLVVDAALGAANAAAMAEMVADLCVSGDPGDDFEDSLALRCAEMRRRSRVAALRAATRPRRRADGLTDLSGPVVDIGAAMLDRLAVDQLEIKTAPALIGDRSFVWLPGAHVQEVEASPLRPSRSHDVVNVRVSTDLGAISAEEIEPAMAACGELGFQAPLSSLVLLPTGRLSLISTVLLHESVWWHRSELVAVMAALQLNSADAVSARLDTLGVHPDLGSDVRTELELQGRRAAYDGIYEVIPDLRSSVADREEGLSALVAVASSNLLREPSSRLFGELDDNPDIVTLVAGLAPEGGWDPPIGEALVEFEIFDHELAGPSVKVRVNPGFPPGGDDLAAVAAQLTQEAHERGQSALCPSWEVTASTVSACLVVPEIALAATGLDNGAELIRQAARSCVQALGDAVTASPSTFPDFDRALVALGRCELPTNLNPVDGSAIAWAPFPNLRVVAVPDPDGDRRWIETSVTLDAAEALARWATGKDDGMVFSHSGTSLSGYLNVGEPTVTFPGERTGITGTDLTDMLLVLAHPEAAAVTGFGRTVTNALSVTLDADGDVVLTIPPSPVSIATLGSDDVCCVGLTGTTATTVWLGFETELTAFAIELDPGLVAQMVSTADSNGMTTITVTHPTVDARLATPPPWWVGQLRVGPLHEALGNSGHG